MQGSLLVLGMACLLPLKTGKLDRPWREKDRNVLAHVHRYTEQRSLKVEKRPFPVFSFLQSLPCFYLAFSFGRHRFHHRVPLPQPGCQIFFFFPKCYFKKCGKFPFKISQSFPLKAWEERESEKSLAFSNSSHQFFLQRNTRHTCFLKIFKKSPQLSSATPERSKLKSFASLIMLAVQTSHWLWKSMEAASRFVFFSAHT